MRGARTTERRDEVVVVRPGEVFPPGGWARRHGTWVVALAAAAAFWEVAPDPCPTCAQLHGSGASGGGPRVHFDRDFARTANDAAIAYLRTLDDGRPLRTVEAAAEAVVRFRVSAERTERPGRVHASGSGVLVNGGRHLLVAGHVLDAVKDRPDPEVTVVMADGTARYAGASHVWAGLDGAPEGDWGMVALGDLPPDGCPSLPMGPLADGATVVLLGYAGGLGVEAGGGVGRDLEHIQRPLRPLTFVGKVEDAGSGRVEVVAGTLPAGGSSGGAIIDLRGNLVAICVESHWWSTASLAPVLPRTGRGTAPSTGSTPIVSYSEEVGFTGTPVAVFRKFIEARWRR